MSKADAQKALMKVQAALARGDLEPSTKDRLTAEKKKLTEHISGGGGGGRPKPKAR